MTDKVVGRNLRDKLAAGVPVSLVNKGYDDNTIIGIQKISEIIDNMSIRCPNCKAIMTQEEYYDDEHLGNAECLARQKEIDDAWKKRQAKMASRWKRKTPKT